jgi:hypothetical protein
VDEFRDCEPGKKVVWIFTDSEGQIRRLTSDWMVKGRWDNLTEGNHWAAYCRDDPEFMQGLVVDGEEHKVESIHTLFFPD